ncbi:hypothetical protein C1645_734961 [Glomus cerebriforme]|uniref:Uncharacterized protein n=1 Tax=Glomus cerebriforme TaxID=658196 RepID=A0A397T7M4_9GLOM|nr:hypothetical protein C1645_734961 [Glomus cerebriforme]
MSLQINMLDNIIYKEDLILEGDKSIRKTLQKLPLRKRVAEVLGILEGTIGSVVLDWNSHGDNIFTPHKVLGRPILEPDKNISEVLRTKILNANKAAHPHHADNILDKELLYKNHVEDPFHPPSPPNRVPITIRARLQELTHQANTDNIDVTPTRIIGQKLDKERITTVFVHQKYNIPKQGRDKGLISRNVMFNKRSRFLLCNSLCFNDRGFRNFFF